MKNTKRFLALLVCIAMLFSFAACSAKGTNDETKPNENESTQSLIPDVEVNIAALKGPTGIGLSGFFQKSDKLTLSEKFNVTIAGSPNEIPPMIIKGETDIAACPINMASMLYKKTNGKVKIIAVNTLGVLSILENGDSIKSIKDLKGKKLAATGQGATPEYILNFILKSNGLDPEKDVEITYYQDHAELAALLVSGKVSLAMLPQPQVTVAMTKKPELRKAIDLTQEWNTATDNKYPLAQGCLVVRSEFLDEHPEAVNAFLKAYEKSCEFTLNSLSEAANAVAQQGILPNAQIAQKAIPDCNIVYLINDEMKSAAQGTLKVLFDANPASVGGALPDDNFYYINK